MRHRVYIFGGYMKRVRVNVLLCAGMLALCAHAATPTTQKESDSQSIELGNVDEQDGANEPMAPAAAAEASSDAPSDKAGAQNVAAQAVKTPATADSATVAEKKPVETPMEKYRDFKLQQAATPNGGNPATGRRYLKVDRATFMESSGIQ